MLKRAARLQRKYTVQADGVAVSKLKNGVKVATLPTASHFSAIGCYIDAGSRYETPLTTGSSHIFDRLAFKSSQKYTQQEMEQGLLSLGGNYMCQSSREAMLYQGSTFHRDFEKFIDYFSQTINHPLLKDQEVAEQVENARFELSEINQKSDEILAEIGHQRAFSTQLGNPLLCPEERLDLITPSQLWAYRLSLYQPNRMTLAFAGVDHDRSMELANKYWGHLEPSGDAGPSRVVSAYRGGEKTIPMAKQIGIIPVFEYLQVLYNSVGIQDKDIYAVSVLQVLLGGGSSFSAGGPGKGMFSRLFTEVLNKYGFVESCMGVHYPYSDGGLLGIRCGVIPGAAKYSAYVVGSQLALLMTPGQLGFDEVERAKNQLKSQLVMNLESRMVELEDTGRQILLFGKKLPVEEMLQGISRLGPKDLEAAAHRVLTGSKPTIVMQGQREEFGDVEKVLKEFGLGTA